MKKFACVFPGQGSQSVGMLNGWTDHPVVNLVLQEASDSLGQDLGALIRDGSKEDLGLTVNTQPVMLVAGVAAWRMWCAEGGASPVAMAGHSLGEYSALVAAGALTLADAVPLVRLRAQAMQQAVPVGEGAMAAVLGLAADQVIEGCREAMDALGADIVDVVDAVNFNDPLQTVIAGSKRAVDKACEIMKSKGAKRALLLPVSAPFHSRLMQPAAQVLAVALEKIDIQTPVIPVVSNVDVALLTSPLEIRDALYRQAFGPVRWVECVKALKAQGATHVLECGPGKVLSGMVKRIDSELVSSAVYDHITLNETLEMVK